MFTSVLPPTSLLYFVAIQGQGVDWRILLVTLIILLVPISYAGKRGVHNLHLIVRVWRTYRRSGVKILRG